MTQNQSTSSARDRILGRLRAAREVPFVHTNAWANAPLGAHAAWEARQPSLDDLPTRFLEAQRAVGSQVVRVSDWAGLSVAVSPWIGTYGIRSAITGRMPRLDALRAHLTSFGVEVGRYDRPVEEQRSDLFAADLGITTSAAAIAETGSIVLIPSPEEPRLLSLAVPVHLAVVETSRLFGTLADFIRSGSYQKAVPTNLVLVSSASRTADIELVLAMGVHGPKVLLVALVG
jgi:L-lactate dehydrogenase complex protein LldG